MEIFNRIQLDQKSKEWLKWRQGGVCATDLDDIKNPQSRSFESLLRSKLGLPKAPVQRQRTFKQIQRAKVTIKAAALDGNYGEGILENFMFEQTGVRGLPICIELKANNQYRASLDWFDFELSPAEFKFTRNLKKFEDFKNGKIEPSYLFQINWIMGLTGYSKLAMGMVFQDGEGDLEIFFQYFDFDSGLFGELKASADVFLKYLNTKTLPAAATAGLLSIV